MVAINPKTCRTCHFNELRSGLVGGIRKEWRGCQKEIRGFPEMENCRDWMRETATDDE